MTRAVADSMNGLISGCSPGIAKSQSRELSSVARKPLRVVAVS